jgi:hypothetical protein
MTSPKISSIEAFFLEAHQFSLFENGIIVHKNSYSIIKSLEKLKRLKTCTESALLKPNEC